MSPERKELIKKDTERLQKRLKVILTAANWTYDDLAKEIGTTKQTISNLCKCKTPLSFTQYIAIRVTFDEYMHKHPSDRFFHDLVHLCLDQEET